MASYNIRTGFLVLLGMYAVVLTWVWFGSVLGSSWATLPYAMLQSGAVVVFATAAWLLLRTLPADDTRPAASRRQGVAFVAGAALLALAIMHWVLLGGPPALEAVLVGSDLGAGIVRSDINAVSLPLANYIPTLVIKSGIPFVVVYLLHVDRQRWAWFFLVCGVVYAISLMQKSYPLYVVVPPVVYLVLTKRWVSAVGVACLGVAAVVSLVLIANPSLFGAPRGGSTDEAEFHLVMYAQAIEAPLRADEVAQEVVTSVAWRVLADPGLAVNLWFDAYPTVFPFTGGCSYRFVAPILGCDPIENSKVIWHLYYPELAKQGYRGSSGAAHFMEEYAAFGPPGLVLSGVLIVGVLVLASWVSVASVLPALAALNLPFVFALSSTGLHTTLLSGGWAFTLLLLALLPLSARARP